MKTKIPFLTKFEAWLGSNTLLKGLAILALIGGLWIGGAELLNQLDPRFDPADHDATYLGDIILLSFTVIFFLLLAAWVYLKPQNRS